MFNRVHTVQQVTPTWAGNWSQLQHSWSQFPADLSIAGHTVWLIKLQILIKKKPCFAQTDKQLRVFESVRAWSLFDVHDVSYDVARTAFTPIALWRQMLVYVCIALSYFFPKRDLNWSYLGETGYLFLPSSGACVFPFLSSWYIQVPPTILHKLVNDVISQY